MRETLVFIFKGGRKLIGCESLQKKEKRFNKQILASIEWKTQGRIVRNLQGERMGKMRDQEEEQTRLGYKCLGQGPVLSIV